MQPSGAAGGGGGQEGGEAAGPRDLQPAVVQLRTLRHVLSVRHRHELPDVSGDDKHHHDPTGFDVRVLKVKTS